MEYKITRAPTDDELMHYGVLGMKWGVRKEPTRSERKALKKKYMNEYLARNKTKAGRGYDRVTGLHRSYANEQLRIDKKARKLNNKINQASYYRSQAEKYKKSNLSSIKYAEKHQAGMKGVKKLLNKMAVRDMKISDKQYDKLIKKYDKEITSIMKKVGSDDNIGMSVYLKDIWGGPADLYDIRRK